MSAPPPISRFCPNCGQAADPADVQCRRCSGGLAPPVGAVRGVHAGNRAGVPGWVLGIIGCVVLTPVLACVLAVVAAIAIPNFLKAQTMRKTLTAEKNLQMIWEAEKKWAAAHDGEYLEFVIEPEDVSDTEFQKLGITLPAIHHTYEAFLDGDELYVTASGNVDEDEFSDEWELASYDGAAEHIADDVLDLSNETGGVGGVVGGVVGGTVEEPVTPGDDGDDDDEEADPEALARAVVEMKSESAAANLEAIWEREVSYRKGHKNYLAFSEGGAITWASLGLTLPEAEHHRYRAVVKDGKLRLTAEGNVDDDPFLDLWTVDAASGEAVQLKSDATNLDLSRLSND